MYKKIIRKNIKSITFISIFILVFTIATALIFILSSINSLNNFTLDSNSINKRNTIIVHGDKKAKVYIKKTGKVEEVDVEEYIQEPIITIKD